jgi:neutral ceramidase
MVSGRIYARQAPLEGATINRSPTSFRRNDPVGPEDVNRMMTLLRFESSDGRPLGVLNWFAVHPTSMGTDNVLLSGDNKGWASLQFELEENGTPQFVAAFANSDSGDASPNVGGVQCPSDSNGTCNPYTSMCSTAPESCVGADEFRHVSTGRGPTRDVIAARAIGILQYQHAQKLSEEAREKGQLLRACGFPVFHF